MLWIASQMIIKYSILLKQKQKVIDFHQNKFLDFDVRNFNSTFWFQVELANFELFSSSPKNFSVSVSDRFPTRDWTLVGHLTAKDERVVQSFNLQHFQFAKYVRVELHSHYGAEHFCPISLFRVYGTSEIEVSVNLLKNLVTKYGVWIV